MGCMWREGVEEDLVVFTVLNKFICEVRAMVIHYKELVNVSLFRERNIISYFLQ